MKRLAIIVCTVFTLIVFSACNNGPLNASVPETPPSEDTLITDLIGPSDIETLSSDDMYDFLASLYANKFSRDEIEQGLSLWSSNQVKEEMLNATYGSMEDLIDTMYTMYADANGETISSNEEDEDSGFNPDGEDSDDGTNTITGPLGEEIMTRSGYYDPMEGINPNDQMVFSSYTIEMIVRQVYNRYETPITYNDVMRIGSLNLDETGITDISDLQYFTGLTVLDIGNNPIYDIEALSYLPYLQNLSLEGLNLTDFSPLYTLYNLTDLELRNTGLYDISFISGMTNLVDLDLSANQISDIRPLSGLTNLTELSVGENQITDISPIASLVNLDTLFIYTNQITDLSPLQSLHNLRTLYWGTNPVTDYSFIKYDAMPWLEHVDPSPSELALRESFGFD